MKKPFTVYISGKISNLPKEIYEAKFKAAEIELQARGYDTWNPCQVEQSMMPKNGSPEQLWLECMLIDIRAIMETCDGIYMLNNWRSSKGARIERIVAQELGLFIAYQEK